MCGLVFNNGTYQYSRHSMDRTEHNEPTRLYNFIKPNVLCDNVLTFRMKLSFDCLNTYSPYSRSFQSEAATTNEYVRLIVNRTGLNCTTYFMSIDNLPCSVKMIKTVS